MDDSKELVPDSEAIDDFDEADFDDDFDDDFEEETEEELRAIEAPHEGDFTSPPEFNGESEWGDADP